MVISQKESLSAGRTVWICVDELHLLTGHFEIGCHLEFCIPLIETLIFIRRQIVTPDFFFPLMRVAVISCFNRPLLPKAFGVISRIIACSKVGDTWQVHGQKQFLL